MSYPPDSTPASPAKRGGRGRLYVTSHKIKRARGWLELPSKYPRAPVAALVPARASLVLGRVDQGVVGTETAPFPVSAQVDARTFLL